MTKRLRAVFDTNIYVSAFLSKNPSSPTKELILRWQNNEFTLLICDALVDEISEKFLTRGIDYADVEEFVTLLATLAEWIEVPSEAIVRIIVDDSDDDVVLACAVVGQADYLITYDTHFNVLAGMYQQIKIVQAIPFLRAVRGIDTSSKDE